MAAFLYDPTGTTSTGFDLCLPVACLVIGALVGYLLYGLRG